MGGPPNKVTKFEVVTGMSSQDVLDALNDLADEGYDSTALYVPCADGNFIFVGGYKK